MKTFEHFLPRVVTAPDELGMRGFTEVLATTRDEIAASEDAYWIRMAPDRTLWDAAGANLPEFIAAGRILRQDDRDLAPGLRARARRIFDSVNARR